MSRTSTIDSPVMVLSDIAALAHVQRAVVSAWRQRPVVRGQVVPFPEPVDVRGGQERFAMTDVVDWLERTDRGNNPDYRADALAHATPSVPLEDAVLDAAVDALLCLKSRTGIDLSQSSREDVLEEADAIDQDDDHLVSELTAAGEDLVSVAAYVESLVDAAWDATSAHEVVLGRRRRGRSTAALGHHAVELAGRLGAAMALDLEGEAVITDPLDADPMLVDAVLTALGEGALVHVLVDGSSPVARAMRRFHWLRGRSVITVPPHDVLPIIVTRLPLAGAGSDPESILATADGVQLDMTESQRALILGPATALCDRLNDSSREQHRDHVVRLGRLRCAVRLPAGLVTDGSRQVVGIWVLAGAPSSRKLDEQRLAAADLTNETLRADVVDDLVTDVMASLSDRARATHNFRYARLTATAPLLASSGPLVAPGSRPTRARTAAVAESVVRVRGLIKQLQTQPPPSLLEGMAVAAGDGEDSRQQVTIEAAIRARELRVLAGTRIAEAVPQTDGGVRVIDAHTVQHPSPPRKGLDPLDLERSWPRARRTEPGDVIFCVSPHPAAIIDWDGLSVVASPARILRCAPGSGLVPEVVARAINALPARSPRWQAWSLPRIPAEQTGELAIALRRIADEEDQARQRLADLSALAHELAHGIARGAMTITPTEEGH